MPRLLLVLLGCYCFFILYTQASVLPCSPPPPSLNASLSRRYVTSIKSPSTAYTYNWAIDGKRISFGTSTGYISRSTVLQSGTITQAAVNACLTKCESTTGCAFTSLVQFSGFSEGDVICGLFSSVVAKSKATYTTGLGSTATVVASYAFARAAGAVTPPPPKMPALPTGATNLIQLKPCSSSTLATVPLFVNSRYASTGQTSTATTAYIVQHGKDVDPQNYFEALYNVVGDSGVVISPGLYETNSTAVPNGYYQPTINMAWEAIENSWSIGADAVGPTSGSNALNGATCSSFDLYDTLVSHLSSKSRYPNLTNLVFVSHSRGSNAQLRYSILNGNAAGFTTRYVIANFATTTFFSKDRPLPIASGCTTATQYPYQLASTGMPRYVKARFTSASTMFKQWAALDFTHLIGDYDTQSREHNPTPTCDQYAQGGVNRRDRNYAWWAHINLLAGTKIDVSQYFGYSNLKASTTPLSGVTFKHQICIVDQVGHDVDLMFSSDCGKAAISGSKLPAGVGPLTP